MMVDADVLFDLYLENTIYFYNDKEEEIGCLVILHISQQN